MKKQPGKQLSFKLDEAPPGPYHLTKAVTLPGERQTYGVSQGANVGDHYGPGKIENPYGEYGMTKKQALRRLAELNDRQKPAS